MTTLPFILVRHAHADWPNYCGRDFDRPLTPRGEEEARLTANALRDAGLRPTRVIASAARRTRQTAELIAATLGLPMEAISLVDDLYNATPATLAATLREAGGSGLPLLVAHNPGVSDFARQLDGDPHAPAFAPAQWRHLVLPG